VLIFWNELKDITNKFFKREPSGWWNKEDVEPQNEDLKGDWVEDGYGMKNCKTSLRAEFEAIIRVCQSCINYLKNITTLNFSHFSASLDWKAKNNVSAFFLSKKGKLSSVELWSFTPKLFGAQY